MDFDTHAQSDPWTAKAAWAKAIAVSSSCLRGHAIVEVSALSPNWIDAGLDLREGEEVSLFSTGVIWLAKDVGIGVKGDVALWHRTGARGTIAKSIGTTTSFRAHQSGRLMLVAKPPGEWLDSTGRFDPNYPRAGAAGALTVAC